MNFDVHSPEASDFPLRLMKAVQDQGEWSAVLDAMLELTGAKGAIITLRDKHTCQIINDVELEQKFHSPLIRGFSTEAIIHYLTNLRTIDPWAEYQRQHYPFRPTQMSKVCPRDSVADQRFFEWLEDLGFTDTIVFELARMSGYWTAINLFLEESTAPEAAKAMAFCNQNYELIRSAWSASQNMGQSLQSCKALLESAVGTETAVCIVGANGELRDHNDLFADVLETDAIRVSGQKRKLSFAHNVSVFGLDRWEQHDLLFHDADVPPQLVIASPIDPDPLFAEKREKLWLLTCNAKPAEQTARTQITALDLTQLTPQEKELYEEIASGKSVAIAGESIDLKRSRTFEVWASVKEKLGITSAHQLRAR